MVWRSEMVWRAHVEGACGGCMWRAHVEGACAWGMCLGNVGALGAYGTLEQVRNVVVQVQHAVVQVQHAVVQVQHVVVEARWKPETIRACVEEGGMGGVGRGAWGMGHLGYRDLQELIT